MTDRRLIAIVAAGVVAVATILIIVFAALVPIPEFAPLVPGEETGYVAYIADEPGERGAVLIVELSTTDVVEADFVGEGEPIGWDEEGHLVIVEFGPRERFVLVDPTTGEQVGTLSPEEAEPYFEEEPVWIDHDEGNILFEVAPGDGVASFSAPESYEVHEARSMGDGRIVFVDELGRVAIIELGEEQTPTLVAEDAQEWWRIAVRP